MMSRRDARHDSIERLQGRRPSLDLTGALEILLQPRAEIGRAAKIGLLQDLSDIIELNALVFVHGSAPDAGRESPLKENSFD
jgi:hypothetical protein